VLIQDEVTANPGVNVRATIARKIERSGGLLAACLELMEPLVSAVTNIRDSGVVKTKLLLDLNEAQRIFGIDRDILLTAMVNHELPSSFTDNGYRIKYKDLEQFVDRYYYRKNSLLGSYCPVNYLTNSHPQMPSSCDQDYRGKQG
jgi:hypothetical protein